MQTVTMINLDVAESVFQIHGIDVAGHVVRRTRLSNVSLWQIVLQKSAVALRWMSSRSLSNETGSKLSAFPKPLLPTSWRERPQTGAGV